MKRIGLIIGVFLAIIMLPGCKSVKLNKTMLKMIVAASTRENKTPCYADSCDRRIGVSYVENGAAAQVVDIASEDRAVGHVHNVIRPELPESHAVNTRMAAFMDRCLE